jgi:hypothetical protein
MAKASTIYEALGRPGLLRKGAGATPFAELTRSVREGLALSSMDAVIERFGLGRGSAPAGPRSRSAPQARPADSR